LINSGYALFLHWAQLLASPDQIITSILKHDRKVNSYKIALVRAINDVALNFPDLAAAGQSVAVPLKLLAELWLAYYWPFADPEAPILQGADPARRRSCKAPILQGAVSIHAGFPHINLPVLGKIAQTQPDAHA